MALQVVSAAISVYRVTGVKDGQEQTEEYTFKRGELLPDWVSSFQQFTLTQTGMARQVGDFPDPALVKAEDVPAPVLMPEHSPQAVIGTNVTGPMEVTRRVDAGSTSTGGFPSTGGLPADTDTKPAWEDYAVTRGFLSRGEAESMKKADLVDAVKAKQSDPAAAVKPAEKPAEKPAQKAAEKPAQKAGQ